MMILLQIQKITHIKFQTFCIQLSIKNTILPVRERLNGSKKGLSIYISKTPRGAMMFRIWRNFK